MSDTELRKYINDDSEDEEPQTNFDLKHKKMVKISSKEG
jgi:hypothetical protein